MSRDVNAGVFGDGGTKAAAINDVIPKGQKGTLAEMFYIMKMEMIKYLDLNIVTKNAKVTVDFNGDEGTFRVLCDNRETSTLMNLGRLTLSQLDNQLKGLREQEKTGNPSQLFLLFFQVFSMLVYEVVVAYLQETDMETVLKPVQRVVNHMVIMLFLFTKPIKLDGTCEIRVLFKSLYDNMKSPSSQELTAEMMAEYDALAAETQCPVKGRDGYTQLLQENATLKTFADAIMIKLGEGAVSLKNAHLDELLIRATASAYKRVVEQEEKAMMDTLVLKHGDGVAGFITAAKEALNMLPTIKVKLDTLRNGIMDLLTSANQSLNTASNDGLQPDVRKAAITTGTNEYARCQALVETIQLFEQVQHMNHMTIQIFDAFPVDNSDDYKLTKENVDKNYNIGNLTVLVTQKRTTSSWTTLVSNGIKKLLEITKVMSGEALVGTFDMSDAWYDNIEGFGDVEMSGVDPWTLAPQTGGARSQLKMGGASEKYVVPEMKTIGARVNHYLQNAYIRSERLYRSFVAQVFLQGDREAMKVDDAMYKALYKENELWVDVCRRACQDSLTRENSSDRDDFVDKVRESHFDVRVYMKQLSTPRTKTGYEKVRRKIQSLNSSDSIQPMLLKTMLVINVQGEPSETNKRYNVIADKSDAFATIQFPQTYPYNRDMAPEDREIIKAGSKIKDSMTVGPLSCIAFAGRYEEKVLEIYNSTLVQRDQLATRPFLIMGYGASGSGKTTLLFGLRNKKDNTEKKGLLEAFVSKLPQVKLPVPPVPPGNAPPPQEEVACNYCHVIVNEYYAYSITQVAKDDAYLEQMAEWSTDNQRDYHGNAHIVDLLRELLKPDTGKKTSSKALPARRFVFTKPQADGPWTLYKSRAGITANPGGGYYETNMIAVLKDSVEAGSFRVSGRPRRVAQTFLNPVSSRSHVIMTLTFGHRQDLATASGNSLLDDPPTDSTTLKPLHIADFAGVENIPDCELMGLAYSRLTKKGEFKDSPRIPSYLTAMQGDLKSEAGKRASFEQYTRYPNAAVPPAVPPVVPPVAASSLSGGAPDTAAFNNMIANITKQNELYKNLQPPITQFPTDLPADEVNEACLFSLLLDFHQPNNDYICKIGHRAYYSYITRHYHDIAGWYIHSRDYQPRNETLMLIMKAVLSMRFQQPGYETSLSNVHHDWGNQISNLKSEYKGGTPTYEQSRCWQANEAMIEAMGTEMTRVLIMLSAVNKIRNEADKMCTWLFSQFIINNAARAEYQCKYNKAVIKHIEEWFDVRRNASASNTDRDHDSFHGSSICRFRAAEGDMINKSIEQVRRVFTENYQPKGVERSTPNETIIGLLQNETQCRIMNNPDYGTNLHHLQINTYNSGTLTPVATAVQKIIQVYDHIPQANALILGVFNISAGRDDPPALDYIPCSEMIQEYKRMEVSALKTACMYENPSLHGDVLQEAPNTTVFDQYRKDLTAAIFRTYDQGEDTSFLKAEMEDLDAVQTVGNRARTGTLLKMISSRTQTNANTAVGTLEFLDQACKLFSTDQTFVHPRRIR